MFFAENRDLVKETLQDRGFKKVRLGIEGFPIDMTAIEPHRATAPENLYRYEQRPYIFISWEKVDSLLCVLNRNLVLFLQEVKSNQHVNFQYVRKSSSFQATSGNGGGRRPPQERWF